MTGARSVNEGSGAQTFRGVEWEAPRPCGFPGKSAWKRGTDTGGSERLESRLFHLSAFELKTQLNRLNVCTKIQTFSSILHFLCNQPFGCIHGADLRLSRAMSEGDTWMLMGFHGTILMHKYLPQTMFKCEKEPGVKVHKTLSTLWSSVSKGIKVLLTWYQKVLSSVDDR